MGAAQKSNTTQAAISSSKVVRKIKEAALVVPKAFAVKSNVVFRSYQIRINDAQDAFMSDPFARRGLIFAATGAGKTECFIDLLMKLISAGKKRICIAHPRIALSMNQQKRLKKAFEGLGVEFTSFHSGKVYHTLDHKENSSTTKKHTLEELQQVAIGSHITFSSYKSLHKIADLYFDIIICDEAHYLVQKQLSDSLHLFKSKVLFYTGTPIDVAAQEESMDNVELFGEVIAEVPPKEILPGRYIVPPRVRIVNVRTKRKGNTVDYPSTIAHAYNDQVQFAHEEFNHKMLVAMPNTKKFHDIMKELPAMRKLVSNQLDVYCISAKMASKNGIVFVDRETALNEFEANENPCIIIHCDTLAEGIDIDGIGGILLLRDLGKTKSIQTIGRGCRAAKADVMENGEICQDRIKTHCIVTLVRIDNGWFSGVQTSDYVEMFKSAGYGELRELMNAEVNVRGEPLDPPDPTPTVWDEIQEIAMCESVKTTFYSLFQEGK